jgi:Holliday junction DNA helicase RuvA
MIASVTGTIGQAGLDRVTVVVGGVGLLVHTTPAAAAASHRGDEVTLATSLVVREDSLTLFGFLTTDERDMFETVQSVSGVGPRIALAMLSVMGPDDLAAALSAGDTKALTTVPGIGVKSAQRLVLELKDKVAGMPRPTTATTPGSAACHHRRLARPGRRGAGRAGLERQAGRRSRRAGRSDRPRRR